MDHVAVAVQGAGDGVAVDVIVAVAGVIVVVAGVVVPAEVLQETQ